ARRRASSTLELLQLEVARRSLYSSFFADGDEPIRLGRYRLLRHVSTGGSGSVYQACDGTRRVAIKIVELRGSKDLARIERECRILQSVSHPRVVRCLGSGRLSGNLRFVVLQWLEGLALRAALDRRSTTPAEALAITKSAAEGLAAIHRL